jgi:hypothetical protein
MCPETRYAKSSEGYVAYQVFGDGEYNDSIRRGVPISRFLCRFRRDMQTRFTSRSSPTARDKNSCPRGVRQRSVPAPSI